MNMELTNDADLNIVARCNNCDETWDKDGSKECPKCRQSSEPVGK
jgi:hypothetical protein